MAGPALFAALCDLGRSPWQVPQGKIICHTCDNPPCVNHEHLFLGTYADNVHDMHAKRRNCLAVGADHKLATHTDADVIRVRELWVQGWSHREVVAITDLLVGLCKRC